MQSGNQTNAEADADRPARKNPYRTLIRNLIGIAPTCDWDETAPDGRTWRDMPGIDEFEKKCHFFFHRRGMLAPFDE